MKKLKFIHVFSILLFLGIIVFSFYMYIGFKFGNGVSKMGKELHEVKKEWKANKENPIDSIESSVTKTIDSVNNRNHKDTLVHKVP